MKAKSFFESDITHEIDLYSLRTGTGTFVVAYRLAICCKIQCNKEANPIKTLPAAMVVCELVWVFDFGKVRAS